MKYKVGENLQLLENMSFKGASKAQPVATATIIAYNELSSKYLVSYVVYGTGQTSEAEVPEERLLPLQQSQLNNA